jgi:hypothetical protein
MNTTTRRTFLKTTAALSAALPLSRVPLAAAPVAGAAGPAASPGGLLFDRADLARIRANLELPRLSEVKAMLTTVDFAAETKFLREELRLNNHVADFMRVWKLVQTCAFAYAVWGDRRQLEVALLGLQRLCDYKRWDYFLEGGKDTIGLQRAPEATIASCYALDWLGDAIPGDLRAAVEAKIISEGAPACYRTLYGMKYPDRVRGWGFDPEDDFKFRFDLSRWPIILNATNLKIIPTCGLGLAAIWFHGRHPEASKWMEMARQSAQAFAVMYGSDGSYDEGVGYWGYTTLHLAMFADALHRRTGLDDRRLINYPGTVRYALAMAMPCGGKTVYDPNIGTAYNATPKINYEPAQDVVNFGDAASGLDVTVAAWVGEIAGDPLSREVARGTGSLKHLQAAVWYRPDGVRQTPGAELHDVRLSNDWVISRTGWAAADTVVALRSGGPANHEHADRNSVILKAHGDRLFHDPFKAGYSPTIPRWLLRQTEAHTSVLINGQGHQYHDGREGTNASWSHARVTDFQTGPGWMVVTSDATEAYALVQSDVTQVLRTLVFLKPDVVLLLDRVTTRADATVQVRFQAFNDDNRASVSTKDSSFRIERPLASVAARVTGPGSLLVQTGKLALPEAEGVFPYAEVVSAAAKSHQILTVATTAPAGEGHGELQARYANDTWTFSGRHRGQTVRATLSTRAGEAPRLSL